MKWPFRKTSLLQLDAGVPSADLQRWRLTGPINGWGYDVNGTHEEMDRGVFVFVDADNNPFYTNHIVGSFSYFSGLPANEDGSIPENAYAYVVGTDTWYRLEPGNQWGELEVCFVGAVTFDSGVGPTRIYSHRTKDFIDAVRSMPRGYGVFRDFNGRFGYFTRMTNAFLADEDFAVLTIHNGHQATLAVANKDDDRPTGSLDPWAVRRGGSASVLTDFFVSDYLLVGPSGQEFWGSQSDIDFRYSNTTQVFRLWRPKSSVPVIPNVGGVAGVHAYKRHGCRYDLR